LAVSTSITGGCQCGAVRYEINGPLSGPHICHCRMCQKAFGNFFAALVGVQKRDFRWSKGEPGIFRSSLLAERGFCRDCGTPLSFAYIDTPHMNVSIGSLDHPERVSPADQFGIESRHPAFAHLHELPGTSTEDDVPPERLAQFKSLQYPDD
jgi:hypothetical protein